jgi:hypothetical protein
MTRIRVLARQDANCPRSYLSARIRDIRVSSVANSRLSAAAQSVQICARHKKTVGQEKNLNHRDTESTEKRRPRNTRALFVTSHPSHGIPSVSLWFDDSLDRMQASAPSDRGQPHDFMSSSDLHAVDRRFKSLVVEFVLPPARHAMGGSRSCPIGKTGRMLKTGATRSRYVDDGP